MHMPSYYTFIWCRFFVCCFLLLVCSHRVLSLTVAEPDASLSLPLPKHCYFSGSYSQSKYFDGVVKPFESHGQFFFDCRKGLVWLSVQPTLEAIIYSLSGNHHRVVGQQASQVLEGVAHHKVGKLLLAIMQGDSRYLMKYFLTTENRHDNNEHFLVLEAKKKSLRKFIDSIAITQKKDAVLVEFNQPNVGSTQLILNAIEVYDAATETLCNHFFSSNVLVCNTLYTANDEEQID